MGERLPCKESDVGSSPTGSTNMRRRAMRIGGVEIDGVLLEAGVAPLGGKDRVYGKIHGDRKGRFPDGNQIITSNIVDQVRMRIVRTRNSVYLLVEDEGSSPDLLQLLTEVKVVVETDGRAIEARYEEVIVDDGRYDVVR